MQIYVPHIICRKKGSGILQSYNFSKSTIITLSVKVLKPAIFIFTGYFSLLLALIFLVYFPCFCLKSFTSYFSPFTVFVDYFWPCRFRYSFPSRLSPVDYLLVICYSYSVNGQNRGFLIFKTVFRFSRGNEVWHDTGSNLWRLTCLSDIRIKARARNNFHK